MRIASWPLLLRARLWRPALLAGLGLSACGPAAAQRASAPAAAEFSGTAYPAPAPVEAGQPQRAVAPPTLAAARLAQLPPPPPPEAQLAAELRNAALRDQHFDQLLRGYFGVVEALYREFGAQRGAEGPYDPLPLLRVHQELQPAMQGMASRAAALDARLSALAAALGLGAAKGAGEAPVDDPLAVDPAQALGKAPARSQTRAARLGRMVAFCRCVAEDLRARLQQTEQVALLRQQGRSDEQLRAEPPAPAQMARDMGLMVRTLQCSKQASQWMQDR